MERMEGMSPEAYDYAVAHIKLGEGFRPRMYICPNGKKTIGYGTRCPLQYGERALIQRTEPEDQLVLSKPEATKLLEMRLQTIWGRFASMFEQEYGRDWREWPERVKVALMDMSYNMGASGLMGFRKTLALIAAWEWEQAADEALNSKWYTDVGDRALRVAAMIRGDTDV